MDIIEHTTEDRPQRMTRGEILTKARAAKTGRRRKVHADPEIEPLALRIPAAARALGIGITSMKELVYSGRIHSIRLGTSRLIPVSALLKFLDGK
jgi:excisionase family DNA binding protein